ncbi:putative mycofactocin binding protein MftB [Asanoa ferruginea]|uniref:Putative mycofactocin binding protein MftB n=1 Tax=Asanoa ferruginea TaxID=53367 RepID=A0A3D9ZRM0_9ACTN|nr:mycofactocin biosynthesis chaperone MftB [Asanoa ferruginea]REF99861.1 putative mycofactocin binding protein MftB [Asanoa ferruginea]GIF52684.1 putative mycofactocin system protein MftB [Asanoa ferruginea]
MSGIDLDRPWGLHPQVAVRPEPFGALLYHFGTRRLSFLKDRTLLDVVNRLDTEPSARAACLEAGVAPADLPRFGRALATLAHGDMVIERTSS